MQRDYAQCCRDNDLLIGEVGVWRNVMARDPAERERNIEFAIRQMELAEEVGANCCVNIAGSPGDLWDGYHPSLDTRAVYDDIIATTRRIIDAVQPQKTCYSLEPMPWMVPESPEQYLQLMQDMGERKSQSERFITRFAKYYTPFVVLAAVALALLPPLLAESFAASFAMWLSRALTFLVISCPCALVISVPLSFFGGIGGASRIGVLIKGSQDLEKLAAVDTVVFDKTGTLTEGSFKVTAVHSVQIGESELLALAAAVERFSNHPIAKAICAASRGDLTATDVVEVAGRGVRATVSGESVSVGNATMMAEMGLTVEPPVDGKTAIFVARCGTYLGCIVISDTVKSGAADAVSELRRCGVKRTVMLTGDRAAAADAVARAVGVDAVRADLLPADKVQEVERLLEDGQAGTLAFVGDGINDAPVLARADLGIAMGALGSDVAIEAADIVLMDDDPRKIARAMRHARRTLRIVRQNIVFALGVKAAVLLCSAFGLLGAWQMPLAIFADVGVAVIAILNAMRTLRGKA